jgi:hypothetical protein
VPYLRAKVRKPHTMAEELILPVAKAITCGIVAQTAVTIIV